MMDTLNADRAAADLVAEMDASLQLERAARFVYGDAAEPWIELGRRYGAEYVQRRMGEGWSLESAEELCAAGVAEENVRLMLRCREMSESIRAVGTALTRMTVDCATAADNFTRFFAQHQRRLRRKRPPSFGGAPWPASVARRPGWRS